MKYLLFFGSFLCFVKVIMTILRAAITFTPNIMMALYYIIEMLVWILLAIILGLAAYHLKRDDVNNPQEII